MNLRTILGVIHSELLHILENMQFSYSKEIRSFLANVKIMTTETTIQYIKQNHCSVSRFGDGEFYIMNGGHNDFQEADNELQKRLIEVFTKRNDKLLVCIPYAWKNLNNLKHLVKVFYKRFLLNNKNSIFNRIDYSYNYGDALFSRFYMDYADKSNCKSIINAIKEIWNNKEIYIVEGVYTRMGVGNDLFDNAKSIHRILGPSKNAFNKYNEILLITKQKVPKNQDTLILIAMGMAATVMAYDLSLDGYQAIDIGHLDVEYEWMRMGATKKVALNNRFVNEANNYSDVNICNDENYQHEIIAQV